MPISIEYIPSPLGRQQACVHLEALQICLAQQCSITLLVLCRVSKSKYSEHAQGFRIELHRRVCITMK